MSDNKELANLRYRRAVAVLETASQSREVHLRGIDAREAHLAFECAVLAMVRAFRDAGPLAA